MFVFVRKSGVSCPNSVTFLHTQVWGLFLPLFAQFVLPRIALRPHVVFCLVVLIFRVLLMQHLSLVGCMTHIIEIVIENFNKKASVVLTDCV